MNSNSESVENISEKEIIILLDLISIEEIITYISSNIVDILLENKEKIKIKKEEDPLYSNRIPIIRIEEYIVRLVKYSKIDKSTLIITYIYIKRFILKEDYLISFNNIFRLIISCLILAIKFNENKTYKNSYYAKIGGLDVNDLNNLEYNIFSRLNFQLRIIDIEFFNLTYKIYKEVKSKG